jgi:hypothetical protein
VGRNEQKKKRQEECGHSLARYCSVQKNSILILYLFSSLTDVGEKHGRLLYSVHYIR